MELVRYENAKRALAEYKDVDDVKDFRDKAIAVQAYAKQANNYDLERDASIARLRAERKCGELLKDMNLRQAREANLKNSPKSNNTTSTKTLSEMGVTKDQSSQWQKLANVPDDVFEKVIERKGMPVSSAQILATASPKTEEKKRIDTASLWIWGTLRDMEESDIFKRPLAELVSEMTDGMRPDADRIIPKLTQWLNKYDNT